MEAAPATSHTRLDDDGPPTPPRTKRVKTDCGLCCDKNCCCCCFKEVPVEETGPAHQSMDEVAMATRGVELAINPSSSEEALQHVAAEEEAKAKEAAEEEAKKTSAAAEEEAKKAKETMTAAVLAKAALERELNEAREAQRKAEEDLHDLQKQNAELKQKSDDAEAKAAELKQKSDATEAKVAAAAELATELETLREENYRLKEQEQLADSRLEATRSELKHQSEQAAAKEAQYKEQIELLNGQIGNLQGDAEERQALVDESRQKLATIKPFVGLRIDNTGEGGVRVKRVIPGAPAAVNGFKEGDVIEQMDSLPCEDSSQVLRYITSKRPGDIISFQTKRPTGMAHITMEIGTRDVSDDELVRLRRRASGIILDADLGVQ